jgi:4-diphosphocytidyl-2-C-methyl-D-erythritol kinase
VSAVAELAFAKLNLVLRVGRPRADGMHPLCSLFASLELADEVQVAPDGGGADTVECPGVSGRNLAGVALAAYRRRVPALPPLRVRIAKRIPVAAGLGGGSADAAAVLRAANRIAGRPLDAEALRELAAGLGSDVPSQVDPGHALVRGVGELVEPVALPPYGVVLLPQVQGLATADVYAALDRLGGGRDELDPAPLRALADDPAALPGALENDLEAAALALRPELAEALGALRAAGALGARVSGSGPTCFGLFPSRAEAELAARPLPGALVTALRAG